MEPYDYKNVLVDEIALDGLDGISLDLLWRRVEKRIGFPVTDKMKTRFWKFIVTRECINFYQNPVPHVVKEIKDRFTILDEETGNLVDLDDYIEQYTYAPIDNEYGSSEHFHIRTLLNQEDLQSKEYSEIEAEFGATMVMVASEEERWNSLAGHLPLSTMRSLASIHYCFLEIIGKTRDNGEMTVGKSNLLKISKDPKLIFYSKKYLKDLNLLKEQVCTQKTFNRAIRVKMLRLNRFHKPTLLSLPKVGIIPHVVDHLLNAPNLTDSANNIFANNPKDKPGKKKKWKCYSMFKLDYQLPNTEIKQSKRKSTKDSVFITLNCVSDESSDSDDEIMETEPVKCQYQVGINILRQAYERIIESGASGLTQTEIAAVLGVGIYTSRIICRSLKKRNFVREFMEDKGRQRSSKFIAVFGGVDKNLHEEQKKFDDYVNKTAQKRKELDADDSDAVTPVKKLKLNSVCDNSFAKTTASEIIEIKNISDVEKIQKQLESKKPMSLRQLKFMNGLLKILEEKKIVSGFRPMATIVSRETSEPLLDAKAVKCILQKLLMDGHIKMYKIKFPCKMLNVVLTCLPHIKPSDPIIKNKLKDLSLRAMLRNVNTKNLPLTKFTQYTYPRYMKIRKLHEILFKIVYVEKKTSQQFGPGFGCLLDVILNSTVEFALGNTSNVTDVDNIKVTDDVLDKKLTEVPEELSQSIIQAKSLQNTLRSNLKFLAFLGLIQLIEKNVDYSDYPDTSGMSSNLLFYVNKNASIINTSGYWPLDNPPIKELEKRFVFATVEDVKNYWDVVHKVSTNTTITSQQRYKKETIRPPIRKLSEVHLYDKGERFGDGHGPCGFDSCFYMDIPHLWRTYLTRIKKTKKTTNKPKATRAAKAKGLSINIKKKPKPKVPKKSRKEVPKPVIKQEEFRPKKKRLRVEGWSKFEDDLLISCKVAMAIMCPIPLSGCTIILNSVARDILTIFDRKKSVGCQCHTRIQRLFKNTSIWHKYECLLNEMKRKHGLIRNYENLLKKMKHQHTANFKQMIKDAQLPMMELVMMTMKVAKYNSLKPKIPCVAINYADFHNKYSIKAISEGKLISTYKTSYDREATIGVIKEGIVQVVMFTSNHILTLDVAKKIQDAFKDETEATLRIALEELRQCGAVKSRDKVMHNYLLFSSIKVQDTIENSFAISVKYKRQWDCRLNSEFADDVADNLMVKIPQTDLKGSAEINCIFAEFQAIDALHFWPIVSPSVTGNTGSMLQEEQLNIIDIEQKVKLRAGGFNWSAKKDYDVLADLYKDVDIGSHIEAMTRNHVIEIDDIERAHAKNSSSKEEIVVYLREKRENGSNLADLQEHCIADREALVTKLIQLESEKIIKRVGFFSNRIVLYEFAKTWAMNLTDKFFLPVPWYTFGGVFMKKIFNQWAACIVNDIFENPGTSLTCIGEKFKYISFRGVQDICILLEKFKCVTLEVVSHDSQLGLFSDDHPPVFSEYNDYEEFENILVFPVVNMITRFAYVKRLVMDNM